MQQKVNGDISNKAVLTVLVIVILVSVVALAAYLRALDKAVPEVTYGANGKVSLYIDAPATFNPDAQIDSEQAKVSLGIDNPNETQNGQNSDIAVQ